MSEWSLGEVAIITAMGGFFLIVTVAFWRSRH